MKYKTFKTFYSPGWWLSVGWFPGEPFRLFSIIVLEALEDRDGKVDTVTLLDIQFLRLAVSMGFNCGP